MGVSLSDNGRYLGVSTLSVENGQGVTQLLLFDTRKGTTLVEERYEGSTPISLDVKGSVLVGILNDRAVSVTKSGQKAEYPYNGGSVTCFDNGSEFGTVLVLGMYQNSLNNRLLLLDEDMDVISDTEIGSEVLGVSVKGNRLALLSNSQVLFYNRRGKAKGAGELVADGKYVLCKGNFAVVMGAETLQRVGKTSSSLQNS